MDNMANQQRFLITELIVLMLFLMKIIQLINIIITKTNGRTLGIVTGFLNTKHKISTATMKL